MEWELEQMWVAHRSGQFSYQIRPMQTGKYAAMQIERSGLKVNSLPVGEFDTLEEAQAACDEAYQAGGLKQSMVPPPPPFETTVKPPPSRNPS